MFGFPSSSQSSSNNSSSARMNINTTTSPNNPFSLSSLAVDISQSSFTQSPTQGSQQSAGTPDWLSSSIPMTSPPGFETHMVENPQQLFQKHDDDEEPQWLLSNNSSNLEDDGSVFSPNGLHDEEHHHQTNMPRVHNNTKQQHSINKQQQQSNHTTNTTHDSHHPYDIYETYSEEYDEGVLLSENHFFRQILHPVAEKRRSGINNVIQVILNHAKLWKERNYAADTKEGEDEDSLKPSHFFQRYSPLISRFAYESPFEDISAAFLKLIEDLEKNYGVRCIQKVDSSSGHLRAISQFFTPLSFKPIYKMASTSDQFNDLHIIQEHFKTIFIDNGVIPHLSQALFTHAHFAEIYYKSYNFLMKSNGPLPLDWRSYIAILAASRHGCKYLVRRLEVEFLLNGGDSEWLKGIEFIPQKLKKLLKFNSLLCHMPWMLNEDSISELVSNSNGVGENAWTMAELVHAVIIMTHFHSLSGFIYGIGILPDDDDTPIADIVNSVTESEESKQRQKSETQKLVETLTKSADDDNNIGPMDKQQREKAFESSTENTSENPAAKIVPNHLYSNYNNFDCFSTPNYASVTFWEAQKQEMMKGKTKKQQQSDSDGLIPSAGHTFVSSSSSSSAASASSSSGVYKPNSSHNREHLLKLKKYKHSKYDFTYKDFDVKNKGYETTSIHDFNWEENAFSLLSRFYYGAADLLDNEFEFIYNMTDNRLSDIKDVDTTSFRAAIWCYVHRLFGVSHDDFNYEKVNKLLNIDLKKYIKTVVCYPERCTKEQFVNTGVKLRTREKIHICLLAIEARKQVEIIYGLRSINNYMQ